jgi:hypothetical protein
MGYAPADSDIAIIKSSLRILISPVTDQAAEVIVADNAPRAIAAR